MFNCCERFSPFFQPVCHANTPTIPHWAHLPREDPYTIFLALPPLPIVPLACRSSTAAMLGVPLRITIMVLVEHVCQWNIPVCSLSQLGIGGPQELGQIWAGRPGGQLACKAGGAGLDGLGWSNAKGSRSSSLNANCRCSTLIYPPVRAGTRHPVRALLHPSPFKPAAQLLQMTHRDSS